MRDFFGDAILGCSEFFEALKAGAAFVVELDYLINVDGDHFSGRAFFDDVRVCGDEFYVDHNFYELSLLT